MINQKPIIGDRVRSMHDPKIVGTVRHLYPKLWCADIFIEGMGLICVNLGFWELVREE